MGKKTELEKLLDDAISNKNWGASSTTMSKIARATESYQDYSKVMDAVWKAIASKPYKWRIIFKGLALLDYLVKHGSERVIEDARDHMYDLRGLSNFSYRTDGVEKGSGVREKSKNLLTLLKDSKRIRKVRKDAAKIRSKITGGTSNRFDSYSGGGIGGGGGRYDIDNDFGRNARDGGRRRKKKSYRDESEEEEEDNSDSDNSDEDSDNDESDEEEEESESEEEIVVKKKSKKKSKKKESKKKSSSSKKKIRIKMKTDVKKSSSKKKSTNNDDDDDDEWADFSSGSSSTSKKKTQKKKTKKKKKKKDDDDDVDDNVISLLEDTDEDDDITLLSSSPSSKKRKRTSMGSRSTKMLEKLERERKIARIKEQEALRLEREASKEEEEVITIEKKEEEVVEEEEGERIALKVRYDTKNIETYKVKPGDPFSVLMKRILKRQKKTQITIKCDGEEVRPQDTALDFDLEDDEMLDVIVG